MPLYEYECKSCGHRFEQYQSFSEPPLTVCPMCGQRLRKVLQPVGIVFKGSGWYVNDSRPSSSSTTTAKSGADAKDTKTESSDSSSSSSTPASNSNGSDTSTKAAAS
ncbi:MAG: FmdB family transcriptional regulator [Chloroflexi bacterium]|nr:FmdB family transcriptional regulator [Chloroflexota bacterium]